MKKKILIEIILSVILIAVLCFQYTLLAANKIPEKKAPQAPIAVKAHYQLQEEEGQNLELKRDPFSAMPIADKNPPSPTADIALSGVLWDEANPLAIINNKVVKTGDRVGGCSVVKIKQDSVVLSDGARDFELKLGR